MTLQEWIDATLAEADRAAEEKRLAEEETNRKEVLRTQMGIRSILGEWGIPAEALPRHFSPEGGLCVGDAVLLPYGAEQMQHGQSAINAYHNGHSHWCYNKEEFAAWLRAHLEHIADEEAFAEGGKT